MKKSTRILMIFFLAIGFSLFYGCSVSYNVSGDWTITLTYPGGGIKIFNVTFSGQKNEGSLTLYGGGWNATGTYEVDNKIIDFEVSSAEGVIIFTGTMDSDNEMRRTANLHAFGSNPICFVSEEFGQLVIFPKLWFTYNKAKQGDINEQQEKSISRIHC